MGIFMKEVKQPADYKSQIQKLRNGGCLIRDEVACEKILSEIGYYRLSAYFLPFKTASGTFVNDTDFNRIYRIYEFDRKLRSLLFTQIEVVEIYLRSSFAYFHTMKYGALGYKEPDNFNEKHNAEKFEKNLQREIQNNAKVPFVKHHLENYDGQFPLWVASELFTFGMISYFYNDLKTADKKILFGQNYENAISWIRCCTDLRNICAHYGRLYYRIFSAAPAGFDLPDREKRRLWGAVLALKAVYPSAEKWNNEFLPNIEALFEEYKDDINLFHIAFPENWLCKLKK